MQRHRVSQFLPFRNLLEQCRNDSYPYIPALTALYSSMYPYARISQFTLTFITINHIPLHPAYKDVHDFASSCIFASNGKDPFYLSGKYLLPFLLASSACPEL